jgi:hypothetical protein
MTSLWPALDRQGFRLRSLPPAPAQRRYWSSDLGTWEVISPVA